MSRAALPCLLGLPGLLGLLGLLAACPPGPSAPDAGGGFTRVETVDVGGLVLYVAGLPGSRTNMGFGLLSPRTGKASATLREVVADGARVMAAGSPDGRTLAWLDGGGLLHVATMGLDAQGTPTLTELRTLPFRGQQFIAFTNSGDRVYSDEAFADPGPDGGLAACANPRHGPIVAPDGLSWVGDCDRIGTLFHDRTPVLVMTSTASLALTADGQWVLNGAPLHLESKTVARRLSDLSPAGSPLGAASPDGLVVPEGSASLTGIDGKRVVGRFINKKFVYEVEDKPLVPFLEPRMDPAAMFEGRGAATAPAGTIPSLDRQPATDGRGWVNLGPLPDGSADAWWFIGWDITFSGTTGDPQQTPRWSGLQLVSRADRRVTNHLDFTVTGACRRFTGPRDLVYGARPEGVVMLGEDSWACAGGATAGSVATQVFSTGLGHTWRGLVKGAKAEWPEVGAVLTTDGRAVVGTNAEVQGQGAALCFTRFTDGVRRCIERPELAQAEPMLSVGHAVAPASGEQASVAWVSHQGAWPGQEVRVFGTRFGVTGTLRVGDVTVPPANITSWTDEEVRFTLPEDAPAAGRVRVDAGKGSDEGARGFFVWRTQRWSGSPLATVPAARADLFQGLSPLVGVEAGRPRSFFIADHEQASPTATTVVGGTHILEARGQCRASDVLWIAEGAYATNRPLRCVGKLDVTKPWTLVPFGHEWAQPERAPRPFQFYGHLITSAGTGPVPFYGKPSWLELVHTPNDVVSREPMARFNDEEHAGTPQTGSLLTRADNSVLRAGHRLAPKTLVRTEALDWLGSQWQLRNGAPIGVNLVAQSVAELGGKLVVAGTDDTDNLRGALRVSTDGATFPTRLVGADATAGSFAPILAFPGGRRAGFVGVSWSAPRGVRGLYTLSTSLALTEDALPAPPGSATLERDQLDFGVFGTALFAWNRAAGTLHVLDTNDVTPAWAPVEFGGKKVTAFMVDVVRGRVLVAAQDTLWRSAEAALSFEPWPSPVQLPVDLGPMTFTSFALDNEGFAHVGVAEWAINPTSSPPVFGSLVGRPVP
jgi:hypothetical protein